MDFRRDVLTNSVRTGSNFSQGYFVAFLDADYLYEPSLNEEATYQMMIYFISINALCPNTKYR
jgi:hypothetical protein